ncbi:TraM recognition domain-containing protein [Longispora sp. NPDC051575]|uniref:type IV secretory system conjugative DNA transfer family protein n=1 Tax=Longispora sp. NPDC051575 TaxID=3154943 RepID=UPI00342781D8
MAEPTCPPASTAPGGGLPDLSTWTFAMVGFGLAILLMMAVISFRQGGGGSSPSGRATPKQLKASELTLKKVKAKTYKSIRVELAKLSKDARKKLAPGEFGLLLGKLYPGFDPIAPLGRLERWAQRTLRWWGLDLYLTLEEVVLLIAPPRAGKTSWMAARVVDYPGSVVTTSTKTDLYELTRGLRAKRGGREHLWNPEELGRAREFVSTFRFSPTAGCEDPDVAMERVASIVGPQAGFSGVTNASFWENNTHKVLRGLFHAAGLGGLRMKHVWAWASNSSDMTPLKILASHPDTAAGWAGELAGLHAKEAALIGNIYAGVADALSFMASPKIAATMDCSAAESFDLDSFILSGKDTLNLIGSHKKSSGIAPLFACFTEALFSRAKVLATHNAKGKRRLNPPLGFMIDEAALICPIPLASWAPDSGGRNISLVISAQDMEQLYMAYGRDGGEAIFNIANTKIILGGGTGVEHLERFSRLCGMVVRKGLESTTTSGDGKVSRHRPLVEQRVLTLDQIKDLPLGRGLVVRGRTRAVLFDYPDIADLPAVVAQLAEEGRTVDLIQLAADLREAELRDELPNQRKGTADEPATTWENGEAQQ